jgi:16S rRNA methyltransferase GidB
LKLTEKFLTEEFHIVNSSIIIQKFIEYENLILKWNSKVNLISRRATGIEDLILNSIFFISEFKFQNGSTICDIGTGGGFPGIPLSILFSQCQFTLVDSIRKKVTALSDIVNSLNLKNVVTVNTRAETLRRFDENFESFDFVISKAVSELKYLYKWSRDLVKPNGKILCIKGGDVTGELRELKKRYSGVRVKVIDFSFNQVYKIDDKKLLIIEPS